MSDNWVWSNDNFGIYTPFLGYALLASNESSTSDTKVFYYILTPLKLLFNLFIKMSKFFATYLYIEDIHQHTNNLDKSYT